MKSVALQDRWKQGGPLMAKPANNSTLMEKIAAFIVDKRTVFFLLYIFALVFSLFSISL